MNTGSDAEKRNANYVNIFLKVNNKNNEKEKVCKSRKIQNVFLAEFLGSMSRSRMYLFIIFVLAKITCFVNKTKEIFWKV